MVIWIPYPIRRARHTVVGDLRVTPMLYSPQLDNARDVLVWLPPDYESSTRRYPVIYMHDALNLFDERSSYAGEWRVDETLTALHPEGYAAIVVGLPNMGEQRAIEYCPYPFTDRNGVPKQGRGDDYVRFIIETVKPLIDATFRTQPQADSTAIAGSSMGGLISHYAFLTYPHVFGICGAFSTAYWFGDNSLLKTTQQLARGAGRIYLDVGTDEGLTLKGWGYQAGDLGVVYRDGVRALRDALLAGGYVDGQTLMYVEDEGARHHELAWAARLPDALRFMLAGLRGA